GLPEDVPPAGRARPALRPQHLPGELLAASPPPGAPRGLGCLRRPAGARRPAAGQETQRVRGTGAPHHRRHGAAPPTAEKAGKTDTVAPTVSHAARARA